MLAVHVFIPAWDGIEIKDLPQLEASFNANISLN